MSNSQQQQQTQSIQQQNVSVPPSGDPSTKLNQFKQNMQQEFDAAALGGHQQAQGLNDVSGQFDDKAQNINNLLNQPTASSLPVGSLDKLPNNALLASGLQGITGQFNAANFQASGLGNLDLSAFGSLTGGLNLGGVPNLPNNLLSDLPVLEGLTSGQNGQQLNGLPNIGNLPGQTTQSIQSLSDNLLKNIQQNPAVNFPFNPDQLAEKDQLAGAELLKQEIPPPQTDLNNLGSVLNQNNIDPLNQIQGKGVGTSGKNTPGQQTQNLQVNSGTTATTPGDNGSSNIVQHDKQIDVKKILQDIQGLSSEFSGANSNNLQDVFKALNGGQTAEQIVKNDQGLNEREDAAKALNSLAGMNEFDQLQGLLNNVQKLEDTDNKVKSNQLDIGSKFPVDQNRQSHQLGQLNIGDYPFNPELQAQLQSLTSNLNQDPSAQFGNLNANLGWNNPQLQTNNILQQLNGYGNQLAGNAAGIPGLGNINGIGFGLNMNLNQLANASSLPPGIAPMRQNPGSVLIPGSQAHVYNFNLKGPDNEIKLFVGGLAYQTQEYDLIDYFKKSGTVVDAIVMRDRQTQRGRGFGFVKMRFESKESAQENKMKLLSAHFSNPTEGHKINGKLVDVKSADDYVKPMPGQQPVQNNNVTTQLLAMSNKEQNANQNLNRNQPGGGDQGKPNFSGAGVRGDGPKFNRDDQSNLMNVTKPNPYVIIKQKESNGAAPGKEGDQKDGGTDENKQIVFEYPKSKIFVGGLDFKLTNDDLKQHFQYFGQIESAVILKDINTGQSRGFGFVTFKDEAVAQDLIQNVQHTNICGRKVDIKSAEPKQNSLNQPPTIIPRKINQGGMYGGGGPNVNGGGNDRHSNQYAMIPQYGDQHNDQGPGNGGRRGGPNDESGQDGLNDSQSSNNYPQRRGGPGDNSMRPRGGGGDYYSRGNDNYGGGSQQYQNPNSQSYSNGGPDYDHFRGGERERGRDYRDRRDKGGGGRYRDDRDRMDRQQRDRDRRNNMGPGDYDDERRERRMDRDRGGGRRRGHYQYSRSDSMDSSKSSSSYNNHHARRSREDRRARNQQRERRGPHHGGGNQASPSRNEKENS